MAILRNSARCKFCEEEVEASLGETAVCTCGNVVILPNEWHIIEDVNAYEDTSECGPDTCEEL
jgi:hypothetical protein